MLLGWNGSTSMRCTLETDIVSASSAGYDCLEIRSCKLADFLREKTAEDLADLLQRHHLRALSINAVENANLAGAGDFAEVQAECQKLCELASRIGCEYVIAAPAPKPASMSMQEVFDRSVEALRDLAAIAQDCNLKLAFEFLGFRDCSVRSMAECRRIIDAAKVDNLKMVIDTFHFHLAGLGADALNSMDIACLAILHIADAEDLPRNQLQDANRLLPGEGVIPLTSILAALREKNYTGPISIELFRPELWDWDPAELARVSKRKILDVCGKAGLHHSQRTY